MMNVDEGLRYCMEIKDLDLLHVAIADALDKHTDGEKITQMERFILGLAYSEFYASGSSDGDYCRASDKRAGFLKKLNLDGWELVQKVEQYFKVRR